MQKSVLKRIACDIAAGFEFVMLGDNRDGYQTFSTILEQINSIKPVFTVYDGDLVYPLIIKMYTLFFRQLQRLGRKNNHTRRTVSMA